MLYTAFKSRKQASATAQKKLLEKLPQLQIDWSKIYSLLFTVTIETKIREFQYKVLNNIVFTNEKMFRLKMIDSPSCAFCKQEIESIEHVFFYCNVTKTSSEAFCIWLFNCNINIQSFAIIHILFGMFNIGDDFIFLNHLILTAKLYIYRCKLNSIHPILRVYKAKIKAVY